MFDELQGSVLAECLWKYAAFLPFKIFSSSFISWYLVFRAVGHQLSFLKVQERQGLRHSAGRGRQVNLSFFGKPDCLTGE